jgi:hypothetical protein
LILQALTELTGLDLAPPSPCFKASNLILAYQNLPSNLEFSSPAQPVKSLICIGIAEHTCADPRELSHLDFLLVLRINIGDYFGLSIVFQWLT